jgi:hypothetical protein
MRKSNPVKNDLFNSLPRKPLILKRLSSQEATPEFVLVGGPFDGKRYNIDLNETSIHLNSGGRVQVYHKTNIEDETGLKVSFFRHQSISDLSAVIKCISNYMM